jgi:hypothetical protein
MTVNHLNTLNTQKKAKRDSNVELLRFLLMVGICLLHLLGHGYGLSYFPENNKATLFQLLLFCLFFPCVPGFIFISGFYGVRFSKKIFLIFAQAFVIFHVFNILQLLEVLPGTGWSIYQHYDPITTHIWWFLTEYICLVFVSPIINAGIESISKNQFRFVIFGLFLYNCVGLYINGRTTGSDFLAFLFVYLLARYIRIHCNRITQNKALFFFVIIYAIEVVLVVGLYVTGHNGRSWWMLMYCNPLVILLGGSYFFIFKNIKTNCLNDNSVISNIINWAGRHCLSIYLVTEINRRWLYSVWADFFDNSFFLGIFVVFASVVIIMAADSLLLAIIKCMINKLEPVVKQFSIFD